MNATFGQQLRNYRKAVKLTQHQLAQIVGTSQELISLYESDNRMPNPDIVVALELALRLRKGELAQYATDETSLGVLAESCEASVDQAFSKLLAAGLSSNDITQHFLPQWWSNELAGRPLIELDCVNEMAARIGISTADLIRKRKVSLAAMPETYARLVAAASETLTTVCPFKYIDKITAFTFDEGKCVVLEPANASKEAPMVPAEPISISQSELNFLQTFAIHERTD